MKKVIDELIKGRDCATQLQSLLRMPAGDRGSTSPDILAGNIFRSFTESLSALNSWDAGGGCRRIPEATHVGSPSSGADLRSVDSDGSSRRPPERDRRGNYKKRKSSKTWTRQAETKEDEHAWRKYGQKKILNAKYPRCYFRCTHKVDRHCLATKQVQKIQEEPPLYQIKYIGDHTCNKVHLDFSEFNLTDFGSRKKNPSSCDVPPIKEEEEEEEEQSALSMNCNLWEDLVPLGSPVVDASDPFLKSSDHGDAVSAVHSTASNSSHKLEMEDFFVEADDQFENVFHFGHAQSHLF